MKILGIQKHHLSSVCLFEDDNLIYFNQEERLSRTKKDVGFPYNCIKEVAKICGRIDALVITGYDSYVGEDHSIINLIRKLGITVNPGFKFYYNNRNHHLSHAANAFYNSGFEDAVVVVWDGRGSTFSLSNGYSAHETTSVFLAKYPNSFNAIYKRLYTPRKIDEDTNVIWDNGFATAKDSWPRWHLKGSKVEIRNDYDLGLMYEGASRSLGFDDEGGKMLGMSAYGKEDPSLPSFINEHGVFDMSSHYFNANYDHKGFAFGKYPEVINNEEKLANYAWRTQRDLEEYGLEFLKKVLKLSGRTNLILTGGVTLNVVANNYYRKNLPANVNIYVEPMCGDEANCIGMAKYYYHERTGNDKIKPLTNVYVCGHDPEYTYTLKEGEIEYQDVSEDTVAEIIKGGNIVALYQGKAESGPRALGNRSLLFDPRVANGKDIVNSVKGRESFRPFAASILEEDASDWFEMRGLTSSPFMMYALDGKEIAKTQVPAVIHLDGTCRIQTVTEKQNPVFYKLINSFKEKTGVPLLMNTSFNLGFEPIIETITNAIDSCRKSKIDYLYLPDIKKMIYFP